jgi:hypothetical protein
MASPLNEQGNMSMVIASQNLLQRWDLFMPEEQKERAEPQFRMLTELSASDTVWRIMTTLVIGATVTGGGFAYSSLQGKVIDLTNQVNVLTQKDTQKLILLIEVKTGIDSAADVSKEPVKTKLKQVTKRIEDSLKQWQMQQYANPEAPPATNAPVRNHNE